MEQYGIYVGLASLFVALTAHAVRVTWQVRGMETDIRTNMDAQIDNVMLDIKAVERSGVERGDTIRHEFGETASAMRQKMHDMETWNRDNFVRKESFELVVSRIEKSMEKLGDRFEEKLDKIVERIQQH